MCIVQSVARPTDFEQPFGPERPPWYHDARFCGCPDTALPRIPVGTGWAAHEIDPGQASPWSAAAEPSAVDLVALCSIAARARLHHVCTRMNKRVPGLVLTEKVRDKIRKGEFSASRCGTVYRAWRRREATDESWKEYRLVAPTLCNCRMHPECDQKIRDRQKTRMEGPWTTFVTLTYPHGGRDVAKDCVSVHKWIRDFTEAVREEIKTFGQRNVRISKQGKREHAKAVRERKDGERHHAIFQYAWVIESHKTGFPHVHMCTNAKFMRASWVEKIWDRITGCKGSHPQVDRVYSVDGVCKYLSTYVSKGGVSPDLLGLWWRKRMWASTRKKEAKQETKWCAESEMAQKELNEETRTPKKWGWREGWKFSCGKRGVYALWERNVGDGSRTSTEWVDGEPAETVRYFDDIGIDEAVREKRIYYEEWEPPIIKIDEGWLTA